MLRIYLTSWVHRNQPPQLRESSRRLTFHLGLTLYRAAPVPDAGTLDDSENKAGPVSPLPAPVKPQEDSGSLRDFMERGFDDNPEELPRPDGEADSEDSPSDREPFENPFNKNRDRNGDQEDLDRLNDRIRANQGRQSSGDSDKPEDGVGVQEGKEDDEQKKPVGLTCDEFRSRISRETIKTLSLDISPPFRPDVFDISEYQELKAKFDANQFERDWTTIDGSVHRARTFGGLGLRKSNRGRHGRRSPRAKHRQFERR